MNSRTFAETFLSSPLPLDILVLSRSRSITDQFLAAQPWMQVSPKPFKIHKLDWADELEAWKGQSRTKVFVLEHPKDSLQFREDVGRLKIFWAPSAFSIIKTLT
jgi:hypothetical protein